MLKSPVYKLANLSENTVRFYIEKKKKENPPVWKIAAWAILTV
jgi:hypothetical protein